MATVQNSNFPLFLEDIYDALRAAVQHLGGPKKVAERLWPHKPIEQARKDLLDMLNRENVRKFDLEEAMGILRMAGDAGYHEPKHWLDQSLGYEKSPPSTPAAERDRLADAIDRATDALSAALRFQQMNQVRAVK